MAITHDDRTQANAEVVPVDGQPIPHPFHIPPPGWYTFGTHADDPDVALEFSAEMDGAGDPRFERPL